jgi:hypothetical protein
VLATPDANVLNACWTPLGTEAAVLPEFLLSRKPNVIDLNQYNARYPYATVADWRAS